MLRHLHIRNFVIVESLDLEFEKGMTVLTGETGAGKSILLDALGLALGDRADSAVVRHGSEKAEISATFAIEDLPAVEDWLAERELDADGECIIRRTISADGRSRAYVNGQPMPVQALRELGEQLVDIHGQHAHQSLLKRTVQRSQLDAFAGNEALAADVTQRFAQWRSLMDELTRLTQAAEERSARLDLLRYQVEELDSVNPTAEELEALEQEHARLANASRLQEGAQLATSLLYEDDASIVTLLNRTVSSLRDLETFDGQLAGARELAESAAIQAKEAASELRHYLDTLQLDPGHLEQVEQRLSDLQDLARKHRVSAEDLPQLHQALQTELAELEQAETRLDGLSGSLEKALAQYRQAAARLSAARNKAGERLSRQVSANMHELGMGGGLFEIVLELVDGEEPSATGLERVEFQVSANAGQPLRPLSKVASGGELSRISLAIQVITAGKGTIPTLIFDEVDVGVGGGVAEMVGRHLRSLGAGRQVLCVTHQPQVAAQGHHHFRISKDTHKGVTRTSVKPLGPEERVAETARMLGGMEITEQTLSHAREMIALAHGPERPKRRRTKASA